MDDRFLYFSDWLHGDLRQYDVSDPANPKLTGQLWLGGLLGKPSDAGRELNGGPQMLQLSYDGAPSLRQQLALLDLGQPVLPRAALLAASGQLFPRGRHGGRRDFFVDFHDRPDGPARAHEVRLQGGDCTTEIFQ
jgi:selenium-binding protein 1